GGPGGRRIDVPLYAADPQIAIEIDESFAAASLEAYRRNRTKDLWLQRRGLLVIRVLADDIQDRLQDIALLIRDVVRERRIRGRRR
ncbi:MAG: restriction endonuclease, partial [Myxococcota bacterium]